MVDHHNVNVYYMTKQWPWPYRIGGLALICFGAYLDLKYIDMCAKEDDLFRERSRMFGDWRARNKINRPHADPEVLRD